MLSFDAVRRGSLPHELADLQNNASYEREIEILSKLAKQKPAALNSIRHLGRLLETEAIADPQLRNVQWVDHILILSGDDRTSLPTHIEAQLQAAGAMPYEICFSEAAKCFVARLLHKFSGAIDEEHLSGFCRDIFDWYRAGCVEIAKYTLHAAFKSSAQGYNVWSQKFSKQLGGQSAWINLFETYPFLLRQLHSFHINRGAALDEFFERFERYRERLEYEFAIRKDTKLSALALGLSDPHRGGRSVFRVELGNSQSIFYKPKSLTMEAVFNQHLNQARVDYGFLPIKILDCGDYGWCENIGEGDTGQRPTRTGKIGRATAACWLLNAGDLHQENVRIAEGGVFLLDAETLLTAPQNPGGRAPEPSWRQNSINSTLLFNSRVGTHRSVMNDSGFDFAAIQQAHIPVAIFSLQNDDVTLSVTRASPQDPIEGEPSAWSPEDFEKIAQAFEVGNIENVKAGLYDFLDSIPSNCPQRLLARDTNFYARLLARIRQPRFMRDAALCAIDLLRLHLGVPEANQNVAALHAIVASEIEQLLSGDIPFFAYDAHSTDLTIADETFIGFFEQSAIEYARNKIADHEPSDLLEQTTLLAVGLQITLPSSKRIGSIESLSPEERAIEVLVQNLLSSSFHPKRGPARWLSLRGDVSGYDINAVIGDRGFFGGALGNLCAIEAITQLDIRPETKFSINQFLDIEAERWGNLLSDQSLPLDILLGRSAGFVGLGGLAMAQTILTQLNSARWRRLHELRAEWLKAADEFIAQDVSLDTISGVAGLILSLGHESNGRQADQSRDQEISVMVLAADKLVRSAKKSEHGWNWTIPGEAKPLLGFAHGWAGIICAIDHAARHASDQGEGERLRAFIQEAMQFPNRLIELEGAWRDRRGGAFSNQPLNRSWCNGAVGIIRGLLTSPSDWCDRTTTEFSAILSSLFEPPRAGEPGRFCCGEAGICDLLLDLGRVYELPELIQTARARLLTAIENVASARFEQDLYDHPEFLFPSLYQGQGGYLYTLARFVSPELPSLSGGQRLSAQPKVVRDLLMGLSHEA